MVPSTVKKKLPDKFWFYEILDFIPLFDKKIAPRAIYTQTIIKNQDSFIIIIHRNNKEWR